LTHLLIDGEELLSFKDLEWSKKNLPILPVNEENELEEENTQPQTAAKNRRRVCLNYVSWAKPVMGETRGYHCDLFLQFFRSHQLHARDQTLII